MPARRGWVAALPEINQEVGYPTQAISAVA